MLWEEIAMATIEPFVFRAPHEVHFGVGELGRLGEVSQRLGGKALIATGRGSAREHGFIDRAQQSLAAAGIEVAVYEGIAPEPPLADVERGREVARAHEADFVVALGGGSAVDVGKAIAALGRTETPVTECHSGGLACDAPGLPCVAIPTTSGTGSEATPNSVLTDPAKAKKSSIRGAALLPEIAIIDPELTVPLPPEPTAHSGLDALCQAIEAYVSKGANPVSDALALRAVRAIAGSLRRAYRDGSDLDARTDMALGSHLAGLALASARLGLVHGLAHPVGVATERPHGLVCGAMLPMVIRANAEHVGRRYSQICDAAGLSDTDPSFMGGAADRLAGWTEKLCSELGVPVKLSELGLSEADLESIAEVAAKAGSTAYNPREMSAGAILDLMRQNL
jgi:alcohol dehydrogenase class IV